MATTTGQPDFDDPNSPDPPRRRFSLVGRIALALLAVAALGATVAFAVNNGQKSHVSKPAEATDSGNRTAGAAPVAPSAPSDTVTTTAQQATAAAVVAAYRAEEAAFFAVIEHYPVDPSDPRLAATMVGPRLTAVENAFSVDRIEAHYAVGTVDLAPVVTSVDGTTATITDCAFDHGRIVNALGQTVSGPDTESTLSHVTLQLTAGTWKVSRFVLSGAGCVPGAA